MPLSVTGALFLFVLSIPVVMRYRIWPMVGTPYLLFGLLFVLLITNLVASVYPDLFAKRIGSWCRTFCFWSALFIVIGGALVTAIVDRSKTAPVFGVHDIILQQEAAMRYLLEGKNPYKETYFGTPLEQWHYDELGSGAVNPALFHFVMPPWYLLFPLPFYFFSVSFLGYFDGRMVILFCLVGTLFVLRRWYKNPSYGSLAVIVTALSPATVDYLIEGRSDMFALFWLIFSLFLLDKKRYVLSSVIFALALMSKQSVWIAFPYFVFYLWLQHRKRIQSVLWPLGVMGLVVIAMSLPFIAWDAKAFFDSIIFYLNGGTAHSYPVSGYGLSMVLYQFGVIKDIHDYYPFVIWQGLLALPTLVVTLWWFIRKPSMAKLVLSYAGCLFVFWYTSRYFNNSHIAYLSSVFALGSLKALDEKDLS